MSNNILFIIFKIQHSGAETVLKSYSKEYIEGPYRILLCVVNRSKQMENVWSYHFEKNKIILTFGWH